MRVLRDAFWPRLIRIHHNTRHTANTRNTPGITAAMIFPVREISDVCLVTLVADGISLDVELTAVGREDVEGIEIGVEMVDEEGAGEDDIFVL